MAFLPERGLCGSVLNLQLVNSFHQMDPYLLYRKVLVFYLLSTQRNLLFCWFGQLSIISRFDEEKKEILLSPAHFSNRSNAASAILISIKEPANY